MLLRPSATHILRPQGLDRKGGLELDKRCRWFSRLFTRHPFGHVISDPSTAREDQHQADQARENAPVHGACLGAGLVSPSSSSFICRTDDCSPVVPLSAKACK